MSAARSPGGKAAKLARSAGAVAKESMGVGRGGLKVAAPPPAVPPHERGVRRSSGVLEIPVGLIVRDDRQPRTEFDEEGLARLGESLKARGQLQAVRVWIDEKRGRYVLIAGERRWRAAKLAGLATLECKVVTRPTLAPSLLAEQLAENLARADLSPLEVAAAVDRLIGQFGWNQAQVARETGLSASSVTRALALRQLPEPIRKLVAAGDVTPSTAYELSKIADLPAKQEELARDVANGTLNHAGVVRVVKRLREGGGLLQSGPPATVYVDPEADRVAMQAAAGGMPTSAPERAEDRAALQIATSGDADASGAILGERPRGGRYKLAELGLTPEDVPWESYSGDTIAGGTQARPSTIRKVIEVCGFPYANVGGGGPGGAQVVELHPLVPRAEWTGPVFTYEERARIVRGQEDGEREQLYRGIVVRCRRREFVLGDRRDRLTVETGGGGGPARTDRAEGTSGTTPPSPAPTPGSAFVECLFDRYAEAGRDLYFYRVGEDDDAHLVTVRVPVGGDPRPSLRLALEAAGRQRGGGPA